MTTLSGYWTGSLEVSARGYSSLHFPSMLIPNVSLQGFVVRMSFRALWTFNFSLPCCSRISRVIFLSLFSDQWKRHVDLGVSVEMYSHCIFHLTNLKTVSAVPVALVFKSPSCCWRALQHALQHHFICKDQNNGEKSLNSQMLHCFSFHHVFSFKFGQYGFTR